MPVTIRRRANDPMRKVNVSIPKDARLIIVGRCDNPDTFNKGKEINAYCRMRHRGNGIYDLWINQPTVTRMCHCWIKQEDDGYYVHDGELVVDGGIAIQAKSSTNGTYLENLGEDDFGRIARNGERPISSGAELTVGGNVIVKISLP